jgi:hypothetical protein
MKIEILKTGLLIEGVIYRSGDVVDKENPPSRLVELADGALIRGEVVARFIEPPAPAAQEELVTEPTEAVTPQNNLKGGRKKR